MLVHNIQYRMISVGSMGIHQQFVWLQSPKMKGGTVQDNKINNTIIGRQTEGTKEAEDNLVTVVIEEDVTNIRII